MTHFYAFFYNVAGHRYAHVDNDDNLAHLQLGKEDEQMNRLITLELPEDKVFEREVSESHFFNLEARMRISLIQSRTSRRDREFLTLNLRLRDKTEKKYPPILGIETRSIFIIFILRF